MRTIVFAVVLTMSVCGCGDRPAPSAQNASTAPSAAPPTVPVKLDKWSWLPRATTHDAAASSIPKDAAVSYRIPEEDPLDAKSEGGWGGIDADGNFVPTDKKSYVVKSGTLISSLGSIQKSAKFGDWDIVYADPERTKRFGWGHCLTSGEILMPRDAFTDPPADLFVKNSFEVETFGDDFVLIRLDPAKKHKLCFMKSGRADLSTVSYLGTNAEVGGQVLERKADGWYAGAKRVSE